MDGYGTCDDLEIFTQYIQTRFLWTPYNGQLLACIIACAQTSIFPLLHAERSDVFFPLQAKEIRDIRAQDSVVFPWAILVPPTHICPFGTISMRFNSIFKVVFLWWKGRQCLWTVNKNLTLQQHIIIKWPNVTEILRNVQDDLKLNAPKLT